MFDISGILGLLLRIYHIDKLCKCYFFVFVLSCMLVFQKNVDLKPSIIVHAGLYCLSSLGKASIFALSAREPASFIQGLYLSSSSSNSTFIIRYVPFKASFYARYFLFKVSVFTSDIFLPQTMFTSNFFLCKVCIYFMISSD